MFLSLADLLISDGDLIDSNGGGCHCAYRSLQCVKCVCVSNAVTSVRS